jgi:hypothetical protein
MGDNGEVNTNMNTSNIGLSSHGRYRKKRPADVQNESSVLSIASTTVHSSSSSYHHRNHRAVTFTSSSTNSFHAPRSHLHRPGSPSFSVRSSRRERDDLSPSRLCSRMEEEEEDLSHSPFSPDKQISRMPGARSRSISPSADGSSSLLSSFSSNHFAAGRSNITTPRLHGRSRLHEFGTPTMNQLQQLSLSANTNTPSVSSISSTRSSTSHGPIRVPTLDRIPSLDALTLADQRRPPRMKPPSPLQSGLFPPINNNNSANNTTNIVLPSLQLLASPNKRRHISRGSSHDPMAAVFELPSDPVAYMRSAGFGTASQGSLSASSSASSLLQPPPLFTSSLTSSTSPAVSPRHASLTYLPLPYSSMSDSTSAASSASPLTVSSFTSSSIGASESNVTSPAPVAVTQPSWQAVPPHQWPTYLMPPPAPVQRNSPASSLTSPPSTASLPAVLSCPLPTRVVSAHPPLVASPPLSARSLAAPGHVSLPAPVPKSFATPAVLGSRSANPHHNSSPALATQADVVRSLLDSSVPLSSLPKAQLALLDMNTLTMVQTELAKRVAQGQTQQQQHQQEQSQMVQQCNMPVSMDEDSSMQCSDEQLPSPVAQSNFAPWHPSLSLRFNAAVHATQLLQDPSTNHNLFPFSPRQISPRVPSPPTQTQMSPRQLEILQMQQQLLQQQQQQQSR